MNRHHAPPLIIHQDFIILIISNTKGFPAKLSGDKPQEAARHNTRPLFGPQDTSPGGGIMFIESELATSTPKFANDNETNTSLHRKGSIGAGGPASEESHSCYTEMVCCLCL